MRRRLTAAGGRLAFAAVFTTALAGGVVATAGPAGASSPPPVCNSIYGHNVTTTTVTGINEQSCSPPLTIRKFPVSIAKLENGTFVTVVSGEGFVSYTCQGTTKNEFQVLGTNFYADCG
jgi:hypothetical protein